MSAVAYMDPLGCRFAVPKVRRGYVRLRDVRFQVFAAVLGFPSGVWG